MSATDQMRNMINELMGSDPGVAEGGDKVPYNDYTVCRSYLVGCCPHDILSSTRMDLGACPKTHDIALRADFERAQKERDHFYDLDALDHLERFFDDCDRKMEIAKRRLAETQAELGQEAAEKADVVLEVNEEIGKTLAEAERLGEEGKVEESLKLMEQLETLRTKKQEAENEYRTSLPASSFQQQKLRVCEVCGAYLGIHDNDRRLADHFGGKLHMGFVFLREKMAELRETAPERRLRRPPPERRTFDYKRGSSDRYRDDRGSRRRRSRSRSRSRDRDRRRRDRDDDSGYKSRKRSRSPRHRRDDDDRRSKSRKRSRSRSRERSKKRERNGSNSVDAEPTGTRLSDVDD